MSIYCHFLILINFLAQVLTPHTVRFVNLPFVLLIMLKNKKLLSVLLVCWALVSNAQQDDLRKDVKHQFGIKGGINYSSVLFKPGVSQELKPGIILGVTYNFMAQPAAGVLIEFLYAQYGWIETFHDPELYYNRSMNYLEMPLLSNFVFGKRKTHVKFQLGPRFSYLLNEEENTNIPEDEERIYYGKEIDDKFEIGLAFGGSFSHLFSFGELQLDARFNATLSNLFDATADFELQNSKNQAIALSVYYWFDAK